MAARSIAPEASSRDERRRFLKRLAFITAATSGVGLPLAMPQAPPKTSNCPAPKAPMADVAGKVAFITGGSSGIGLGIAHAFANAGMKVAIGYKTKKHLETALRVLQKAQGRIHAISVDVTDRPAMEKAAAEVVLRFGKIHVLVNNAGVIGVARLSGTTYADWDWTVNVNLNGVFNGTHAFLPYIQSHNEGGQIITTSSEAGLIATTDSAAYNATKFAVVGLMESLKAELAQTNIGVSVYCAGVVRSNILDSARNRPKENSATGFNKDAKFMEELEKTLRNPEIAMDPLDAGQLVLDGMRNNDLYIISPRSVIKDLLIARHEALLASLPMGHDQDAPIAAAPANNSIYTLARDRRLCSANVRRRD